MILFENFIEKLKDFNANVYEIIMQILSGESDIDLKKVILIGVAIIGLMILFSGIKLIARFFTRRKAERNLVTIEILPKEGTSLEQIENLLEYLHGMLLNTKMRSLWYGDPYMSFEIKATEGLIKYYCMVPKNYSNQFIERVYATYPDTLVRSRDGDHLEHKYWQSGTEKLNLIIKHFVYQVQRIKDGFEHYKIVSEASGDEQKKTSFFGTIFKAITFKGSIRKKPTKIQVGKKRKRAFADEMILFKDYIYPIKTKDVNLDSAIASSMKNLEYHETLIFQVMVKPISSKWASRSRKTIEKFEKTGELPGDKRNSGLAKEFNELSDQLKSEIHDMKGTTAKSTNSTRKSQYERHEIRGVTEKNKHYGFDTKIRIMAVGQSKTRNREKVKALSAALNGLKELNEFKRKKVYNKKRFYRHLRLRRFPLKESKNILNDQELRNIFMKLPDQVTIEGISEIEQLQIKELPPPRNVEEKINLYGINDFRGKQTICGLTDEDALRHVSIKGETGTGKTELLLKSLLDHVRRGYGAALIEPHGEFAQTFLERCPPERRADVILFDLASDHVPELNMLYNKPGMSEVALEKQRTSVIELFRKTFSDAWSGKNENFFENGVKTLMAANESIVLLSKLFSDRKWRESLIMEYVRDPQVLQFWNDLFIYDKDGKLIKETQSTVNSLQYKLDSFLSSPSFKRAVGAETMIDWQEAMDQNKIIIFKLVKENLTKERIKFLGTMGLEFLVNAAFERNPKTRRSNIFKIVIDEAENFADKKLEELINELRKYGVMLEIAFHSNSQLDKVKGLSKALQGVGTKIVFKTKPDAKFEADEFGGGITETNIKELPFRHAYVQFLVNGATSKVFNIRTLDRDEVTTDVANQSVFEIEKFNRENRKHKSEVDKIINKKLLSSEIEITERSVEEVTGFNSDELEDLMNPVPEDYQSEDFGQPEMVGAEKQAAVNGFDAAVNNTTGHDLPGEVQDPWDWSVDFDPEEVTDPSCGESPDKVIVLEENSTENENITENNDKSENSKTDEEQNGELKQNHWDF